MIYQGHQEFPPESVIKKTNQIAFSHCCMVVIRFNFLLQSSEFYLPFGLVYWFIHYNGNSILSGGNSWCIFSSQQLIPYMTSNDWLTDFSQPIGSCLAGGHHELLIYCSRWSLISKDKKIYRPQMIVDDRCYIRLRWSCFKRDRISPNRADGTHKTDRTDSTDGIDRTDGIDGTDGTIMILAMLLKYSLCIFLIICIYDIENVTNKAPVKMAMWSIKTISK